jgi:purine-cytosine permease-like protein
VNLDDFMESIPISLVAWAIIALVFPFLIGFSSPELYLIFISDTSGLIIYLVALIISMYIYEVRRERTIRERIRERRKTDQ